MRETQLQNITPELICCDRIWNRNTNGLGNKLCKGRDSRICCAKQQTSKTKINKTQEYNLLDKKLLFNKKQ